LIHRQYIFPIISKFVIIQIIKVVPDTLESTCVIIVTVKKERIIPTLSFELEAILL